MMALVVPSCQLHWRQFLLDCIVIPGISAYIKIIKIGEFLCNHLILKMEENMQCFHYIMLSYFQKSKSTTEKQKKMGAVYGESAMTNQMCQKWFRKFLWTIDILAK